MKRFFSVSHILTAFLCACSASVPPPETAPPPQTGQTAADTDTETRTRESLLSCPALGVHTGPFPDVEETDRTAATWVNRSADFGPVDQPLLSVSDIETHNRAVGKRGEGVFSQNDLLTPVTQELSAMVRDRLDAFVKRARDEQYVQAGGKKIDDALLSEITRGAASATPVRDNLRVSLETLQLRCVPLNEPIFSGSGDETYDRNACSAIAPQDVVDVIGVWPNGMRLVRTVYTFGWLATDAPLSPPIAEDQKRRLINGPRLLAFRDTTLALESGATIPASRFTRFVLDPSSARVWVATDTGVQRARISSDLVATERPLTRRDLIETAFTFLDSPYGYGGMNGGRDCSGFVADLFSAFNIALPRTSEWQSRAGTFQIDVSGATGDAEKLRWIDQAQQSGIVLLYFPGHIMLYLGRNAQGVPMALHSLGEYAAPCENGGETIRRVQRIVVTDLSLGKGSSRRSLLERTTAVVVLGRPPIDPIAGAATLRPAAPPTAFPSDCNDSDSLRIFVSPARPVIGEPVRIIAVGDSLHAPAALTVWNTDHSLRPVVTDHSVGIPSAWIAEFVPDQRRRWTVTLSDGDKVLACQSFTVRDKTLRPRRIQPESPYWKNRWKWEHDTENFFSVFVERLFDFPLDEDRTWNNLQALLADPRQNILHNHLGQNEDDNLTLSPDCADLPFVLRAYFAWKISAPFGVRSCSRGRTGRPPSCGDIIRSNEMTYEPADEKKTLLVDAFQKFASVDVSWSIHSAAARTSPFQSDTDLYPIPLERRYLPPGTVYADPYGHVMMITRWIPQKPGVSGVLMSVDGQPDNTIGRRRFWPGTFLFDPDTSSFGAGFKRFRPLVKKRVTDPDTGVRAMAVVPLENRDLRSGRVFAPFSTAQYDISREQFYERMDTLINPFPRSAIAVIESRLDALEESVRRRVAAVELGRGWAKDNNRIIDMPQGHDIFETVGPWEDFASPSRDMRLLIAIDDVLGLLDRIRSNPERFGIDRADAGAEIPQLAERISAELSARTFTYPGSDGAPVTLSLAQVIARQNALEVGWNPNDCPEVRWGAPEGTEEYRKCAVRAPETQQQQMKEYRSWFHTRTRPARED